MRALILILLVATGAATPLLPATRVSLGYGAQLNSLLNITLNHQVEKVAFNRDTMSLTGYSGTQFYNSAWSAGDAANAAAYPLVHLPEIRIAADGAGTVGGYNWGVFSSVAGIVPQTSAYYLGSYQLKESSICSGVDYAQCPLAATNFVTSSGIATYDAEFRSHLRFYNLNGGFTFGKKISTIAQGELTFVAELGLSVQSISVHSQLVAARCHGGTGTPCSQNSQVRIVQTEFKTQSTYALGPVVGANLRYEQPQAFWFLEWGASVTVLFGRVSNHGYTSFTAAGTVAFSQTPEALGVDTTQGFFTVLPAVIMRAGIRL